MREINVYAYHSDFGTLCRDATLDNAKGLSYPSGNKQGQAGWHIAIRFESLSDLARKLTSKVPMPKEFCSQWFQDCEPIERGEIARLALMAHGDQGGVWAPNGKNRKLVTAADVPSYHADLHTIGLFTNEQSTVLLMGCLSGQGEPGTKLLGALSRIWTHRTVVAFTTIGYRHPGTMKRLGEPCELPGMRDTDATSDLYVSDSRYQDKLGSMWNDFEKLPWASEKSLHVKVIKDGSVVRCPNDELCAPPTPPAQKGKRQPPRQGGKR